MQRRFLLATGPALLLSRGWGRAATADAIAEYERLTGGHIGMFAKNIVTGKKITWRADERFVMCSTFKASLVALILSHVDQGTEHPDTFLPYTAADIPNWHAPVAKANLSAGGMTLRAMCQAAIQQSDNTCATILMKRMGGPMAVTSFWRSLGDQVSRLDDPEPILNRTPAGEVRDTTTPASMAAILQKLCLGNVLSQASRTQFVDWLKGNQTGGNRLRAGLPPGWIVGDKTGNNAVDAAGDIAIAWPKPDMPIVMAVYTRGGHPTDQQLLNAFSGVARMIAQALSGT